jgi:hypothetical protein
MTKLARFVTILLALVVVSCDRMKPMERDSDDQFFIAERYVKLVLEVGEHDRNFVDAYYGDPAWKPTGGKAPLKDLAARARELRQRLGQPGNDQDEMRRLRHAYLDKQLAAVEARIAMLSGEKFTLTRRPGACTTPSRRISPRPISSPPSTSWKNCCRARLAVRAVHRVPEGLRDSCGQGGCRVRGGD